MQHPANRLIHETSPYLKQHAFNPVDWYPWGKEALAKAKAEDKPIIVSIGYSACHWCHVMERECFEDKDLASLMNEYFVCIKVDREERPDVDAIYMDALHAMGLQGGWPLNVFLTPDQKPFYGGTYFPPRNWAQLLRGVNKAWNEKRADILESAENFTKHLQQSEAEKYGLGKLKEPFEKESFLGFIHVLSHRFDRDLGGIDKAPKFPMPCIWQFLTDHYFHSKEELSLEQLELTLDEMARGGIYDQIGGGFARYSVDAEWHVPHFEKMLYDNGQLLELYAKAYQLTGNELYRRVILDTVGWIEREMTTKQGGFYSALDADSEGVEGKFYVWTVEEVNALFAPEEAQKICDFYDVQPGGNWEGHSILRRTVPDDIFIRRHGLNKADWENKLLEINRIMLNKRAERIRPGLDDKILAGWNGLALSGLAQAYLALGEASIRDLALKNADFICSQLVQDGNLYRTLKNGQAAIPAFLEDYAAVIQGLLDVYRIDFDEKWIHTARNLSDKAIEQFWDTKEKFFFFHSDAEETLIANKKEIFDNVIPASNSIMARNLIRLGHIFPLEAYADMGKQMLSAVAPLLKKEVQYLSNWAISYAHLALPYVEVAVTGSNANAAAQELLKAWNPNLSVFALEIGTSALSIFEGRAPKEQTTFYVCIGKSCQLPVHTAQEAMKMIRELQR